MRGKVLICVKAYICCRITPAYAGKRVLIFSVPCGRTDHPRLCGEKVLSSKLPNAKKGSPPPMRGKVSVISFSPRPVGITPAYAGKSVK